MVNYDVIVLRKPIISVLSNISSTIMPESHTTQELGYLEMYALAIKDGTITENERRMLDLQARSYGIKNERRLYLENWFNDNLVDDENGISNLSEIAHKPRPNLSPRRTRQQYEFVCKPRPQAR